MKIERDTSSDIKSSASALTRRDSRCASAILAGMSLPVVSLLLSTGMFLSVPTGSVLAQGLPDDDIAGAEPITIDTSALPADDQIAQRIQRVYSQIDSLSAIVVTVREGVVFLSGSVSNETQAERAIALAARLQGVVAVDDGMNRSLDIHGNVAPLIEQFQADITRWSRALPLIVLALGLFLLIAYIGHRLARWTSLWRRIAPNPFLGELIGQVVRTVTIVFGLVLALNLVGASALIGTVLGGAGVVGLAIGFAVRDSLENYISSIMLSLKQPFRANDHVVIGDHEGKVARLTSRATVLMTLDGNHLRIPNAQVFKAVILNYTRNPERRFQFELGVDAADDPVAAMRIGLDAMCALPYVLDDPEPDAIISTVGDSNIIITFMAWIDQGVSDFGKSRSLAIRAAMTVLEEQGFTLPEPIYRLRFDLQQLRQAMHFYDAVMPEAATENSRTGIDAKPTLRKTTAIEATMDVSPNKHLEDKVNEERAMNAESDLLDIDRPIE